MKSKTKYALFMTGTTFSSYDALLMFLLYHILMGAHFTFSVMCFCRRGLEFKHIDPNLFNFCKKVGEEMRVSFGLGRS